jgi:hypothetical protein
MGEDSVIHVEKYSKDLKVKPSSKAFTNLYIKNFPSPNFQESDLYVNSYFIYHARKSSQSMA